MSWERTPGTWPNPCGCAPARRWSSATGAGADYRCALEAVSDGQVRCRILSRAPSETEPRIAVTLYQALPKGDKLDFIVQKAVELGAVEVVPVLTRLCVSRPDERAAEKKVQRLQKIAEEAAKQSGRGILPAVRPLLPLDRALERMGASDLSLICYEGGGEPFTSLLPRKELRTLSLLVGSEGGFDPEEVQAARERGVRPVTLGRGFSAVRPLPLPPSPPSCSCPARWPSQTPADFPQRKEAAP